jgi:hypothetical protein
MLQTSAEDARERLELMRYRYEWLDAAAVPPDL